MFYKHKFIIRNPVKFHLFFYYKIKTKQNKVCGGQEKIQLKVKLDQMIQQRSNITSGNNQVEEILISQISSNPYEWQRVLENISVVALQKLSSQTIGILSDKQIIILNVKTQKIEQKVKPQRKATCLTILNSPKVYSSNISSLIKTIKKKKSPKCLQFFTGNFDGTITMWCFTNNKIKQTKVFSDPDSNDRCPINCINIMKYTDSLPQTSSSRHIHGHINDSIRRFKKEVFNNSQSHQITTKLYPKKTTQYLLLSGHQNGNVKQWNILTGQCIKEIQTKHNSILFCLNSIQDRLLTGGYNKIQMHKANSTNSSSNSFCNTPTLQKFSSTPNSSTFNAQIHKDNKIREESLSNEGDQWRDSLVDEWSEIPTTKDSLQNQNKQKGKSQNGDDNVVRNMLVFNNNSILTHGFNKDITEWNLQQNKVTKRKFIGHSDNVKCIERLNNNQFITGGRDSKIIVWNKDTQQNQVLEGAHSQAINSISAMDEKSFISSGEDNKVFFWKQSQPQ